MHVGHRCLGRSNADRLRLRLVPVDVAEELEQRDVLLRGPVGDPPLD
jgi:hypothetical protein